MQYATSDLCDAHEGKVRVAAPIFRSFGGRKAFHGQIATLKLFEDNGLVRQALETPGAERVLVIDGGGSLRCALLGDQLAALAVKNGWAGVVVWGCIRDSAAIAAMDLGVLALATHPQKTVKKNLGEAGVPVCFAGIEFRPGDWLYADADGLIVAAERLH
ncbi:ribonuclease E activity regulator RraA [Sulfuricystis multivorans]|uniref:ribonuclease E activity regulator RraA n=1 Tax=Sulfuricystis multivorans TaxID=2211108 RepID=UPI000F83178F|nr:ribonuclease E activity regulator RraA [Sulfuricystis multivorans]